MRVRAVVPARGQDCESKLLLDPQNGLAKACIMFVPAWHRLALRRDALAGNSRSRTTSCASALSCMQIQWSYKSA